MWFRGVYCKPNSEECTALASFFFCEEKGRGVEEFINVMGLHEERVEL